VANYLLIAGVAQPRVKGSTLTVTRPIQWWPWSTSVYWC